MVETVPDAAPAPGYGPLDGQRWVDEAPKSASRTPFERDRARLVHSAALRRLGAKTQVRTLWRTAEAHLVDDFMRTRLTHSLEVAQVGRELGKLLGCDPDVVDTACLAHDLGHPPFGHNGERALDQVSKAIGGFEGNAQTLRVLTRLEAKVVDPGSGRSVGLNLTRACLDAAVKYPWLRGAGPVGTPPEKFGVYAGDLEVFDWLRSGSGSPGGAGRRCLEAQVMDFADDVAYCVHDVEDGIVAGAIELLALADAATCAAVAAMAWERYAPEVELAELEAAGRRLADLEYWPRSWDGSRAGLAGLKDLTSQLIGRFCTAATGATRQRYGFGRLTRYGAWLVVPSGTAAEIAILKALAALFVMEPRVKDPVYMAQREIIAELYDRLGRSAPAGLELEYQGDWALASDDDARWRVIVDQIASLTDASAMAIQAGGGRLAL